MIVLAAIPGTQPANPVMQEFPIIERDQHASLVVIFLFKRSHYLSKNRRS